MPSDADITVSPPMRQLIALTAPDDDPTTSSPTDEIHCIDKIPSPARNRTTRRSRTEAAVSVMPPPPPPPPLNDENDDDDDRSGRTPSALFIGDKLPNDSISAELPPGPPMRTLISMSSGIAGSSAKKDKHPSASPITSSLFSGQKQSAWHTAPLLYEQGNETTGSSTCCVVGLRFTITHRPAPIVTAYAYSLDKVTHASISVSMRRAIALLVVVAVAAAVAVIDDEVMLLFLRPATTPGGSRSHTLYTDSMSERVTSMGKKFEFGGCLARALTMLALKERLRESTENRTSAPATDVIARKPDDSMYNMLVTASPWGSALYEPISVAASLSANIRMRWYDPAAKNTDDTSTPSLRWQCTMLPTEQQSKKSIRRRISFDAIDTMSTSLSTHPKSHLRLRWSSARHMISTSSSSSLRQNTSIAGPATSVDDGGWLSLDIRNRSLSSPSSSRPSTISYVTTRRESLMYKRRCWASTTRPLTGPRRVVCTISMSWASPSSSSSSSSSSSFSRGGWL
eukprot:PhM_4_TR16117/c2_g1_i1/m.84909